MWWLFLRPRASRVNRIIRALIRQWWSVTTSSRILFFPLPPSALRAISTGRDPAHVRGAVFYDRKRYVLSGAQLLPGLIVSNIISIEGERFILIRWCDLPGCFVCVIRRNASFWHLL